MRKADIQKGDFYVGGSMNRIREVTTAHDWWVDWRDIDPDNLPSFGFFERKGNCSPKSFAAWAKRKAEPDEVTAKKSRAQ